MKQYVIKASREARTYTSWVQPNQQHEDALQAFVDVLFDDERFQASFRPFCERISFYGAINSLSQLLLKVTSPGLPDFYRGEVSWDFSLVDPDNRRPVDFAPLTDFSWKARDLMSTWADGRVKVFLTEKLLGFRTGSLELFTTGSYASSAGLWKAGAKRLRFRAILGRSVVHCRGPTVRHPAFRYDTAADRYSCLARFGPHASRWRPATVEKRDYRRAALCSQRAASHIPRSRAFSCRFIELTLNSTLSAWTPTRSRYRWQC